jgi:2-methylaconitate cis-trans-isomerase PrpF
MRDVLANAIKSLNDISGSKRRKLFPTGLTGDEFEQVLSALVIETINAALAVPISNTAELIGDANLGARSFRAGGQFVSNKDLLNLPSEMAQSIANTAQDAVRKTLEK